uniref:Uncharacterized protein n=1 Tax=Steinernema glaseri TaxID=37863 RepID=A0A1I7Z928_9BILA
MFPSPHRPSLASSSNHPHPNNINGVNNNGLNGYHAAAAAANGYAAARTPEQSPRLRETNANLQQVGFLREGSYGRRKRRFKESQGTGSQGSKGGIFGRQEVGNEAYSSALIIFSFLFSSELSSFSSEGWTLMSERYIPKIPQLCCPMDLMK